MEKIKTIKVEPPQPSASNLALFSLYSSPSFFSRAVSSLFLQFSKYRLGFSLPCLKIQQHPIASRIKSGLCSIAGTILHSLVFPFLGPHSDPLSYTSLSPGYLIIFNQLWPCPLSLPEGPPYFKVQLKKNLSCEDTLESVYWNNYAFLFVLIKLLIH